MNSITKPGEKAAVTIEAKAGWKLLQDGTPKRIRSSVRVEEILGNKFVGGTIVHISRYHCLELRDKIKEILVEEDRVLIRTEEGRDWVGLISATSITEREGIVQLEGPYCGNTCKIAPKGVEIPMNESLKMLIDSLNVSG